MSRGEHLARTYWFDLLIALLALVAMLDVVLGRGSSGAPTTTLWFCLPALAILVLPVLARRWFPCAALESTHCRIAGGVAVGLGLGDRVAHALLQVFERWDGKGTPSGLQGERIAIASRLVALAVIVEFCRRLGGAEAAVEAAVRRRGTQFDPGLVDRLRAGAPRLLAGLDATTSWDEVIGAEPALRPTPSGPAVDGALEAISDLVDLKSPFMTGHSRGVAEPACAADLAHLLGLLELGE